MSSGRYSKNAVNERQFMNIIKGSYVKAEDADN